MTIKKNDFIEIEYTGKIKEDEMVFDTTDEKVAKDNGLEQENTNYGPVTICVGENQVLPGLDKALEGKEEGKDISVELGPEDAFGKKDAKLIQLVQTSKFKKQGIQPMPGLQVNIDGTMATIKTVSGGRTLIDFNHPLAGKDVVYTVKINKIVKDDTKKLEAYINVALGIKDVDVEIKEGKATVGLKAELPKEITCQLSEKIKNVITSIKEIDFVAKKDEKSPKKDLESQGKKQ